MSENRLGKPRVVKTWILEHPVVRYDPRRVAAEDKLDADWHEAVKRAKAKISAEWQGDSDDVVGQIQATTPLIPPWPPGFQERRRTCNRCGSRIEYDSDHDALYCWRCNRWIEEPCEQPHCEFCANRPVKPLPDR